ncbi:hypothetical protein OH491_06710 [Termitidicoccus mucosus]|uniref:hypothetical protein n=1 Tax=Termitidicoccus mucosus TaxID=1184151 RepID=UPI00318452FF
MTKLLWLIPALPLAAAAIGAVTPRRSRALSSTLALVAMAAGFVLSCLALRDAPGPPRTRASTSPGSNPAGSTSNSASCSTRSPRSCS